jgi:hypothetical protein
MQTVLVLITFSLAVGFLLKKFVWDPISESRKKVVSSPTLDGGRTKCGNKDCACH